MKRYGRKEPYTAIGIRRLPCCRCGRPAVHQWSACADGNLQRPLCMECDIGLNEVALRFIGDPDTDAKIAAYREKNKHLLQPS
jgi:hypothetical protein